MKDPKSMDYGAMLDKDLLGYLPVKLVPAVTGFAAILILTHNLIPVEYGIYSVVMASVLLMNQIFGTWLSNAVLYIYPDYQKKYGREFQFLTVKLQGIAALAAVIIGYTVITLTTRDHLLGLIGAFIILSQLFQSVMMTFLQSARYVTGQAVSVIIQSLSQLAVLCVLIYLANGKEAAALLAVLAGSIASIPVLLFKTGILPWKRTRAEDMAVGEVFRKLLSYGLPMCIWFFATQFYIISDRILLTWFGATAGLGQYASFRDLATGCAGLLTMPLLLASHPIIMSMWKNKAERSAIEQLMTRNLVILTVLFAPIFVAVDLVGAELLVGIFGRKYLLDRPTMLLVVGSIYLGCVTMYVQKGLEVTGKTLRMAMIAMAAAVISLGGNIIAIPRYGVLGAAAIVVLVQVFYLIFIWHTTRNILSPKVPIAILRQLALWVIGIETICRMLDSLSGELGLFWGSTLFRLVLISGATCALYFANNEISLFCNALFQNFRRLLSDNNK